MSKELDVIIEAFLDEVVISKSEVAPKESREALTHWLWPDDKKQFDELQEMTRKEFGKKLREAVKLTINKVYEKTRNRISA